MKQIAKLSCLMCCAVAALSISACGGKKGIQESPNIKEENIDKLPDWVINPEVPNGVAAVGIAAPSRGGLQFQIPKAELDAKTKIAALIQSEVSSVTKNAMRESNTNGMNDVENVFTQATKEVVDNMPMSGVKRINMWQHKDGTLYVHMLLDNSDYSQYITNSRKIYEQRLRDANLKPESLTKAQSAVQSLFDELETERNRKQQQLQPVAVTTPAVQE